ncbi:hypothetical protein EV714DRAFT_222661, partial [Schizophyllum commune]
HSVWMKLDGARRERHKTSILREVFDLTHDIDYHKTHDRILRIRCYSIGGDCWDRTVGLKRGMDLPSSDRFEIGNLYATLVRLKCGDVSLAIAQCTGIKSGSSGSLAAVPRAELTLADSTYSVSGQILSLKAAVNVGRQAQWEWDKSYVAFEPWKARKPSVPPDPSAATKRGHLVLTSPAPLIVPLLGEAMIAEISLADVDASEEVATWVLDESQMARLRETLWARVSDAESPLRASIPTYGSVLRGAFPYCGSSTPGMFTVVPISRSDCLILLQVTSLVIYHTEPALSSACIKMISAFLAVYVGSK